MPSILRSILDILHRLSLRFHYYYASLINNINVFFCLNITQSLHLKILAINSILWFFCRRTSDLKNEYRMPSMERITDVEKQNSVYELIDAAESEIVWGFVFFFFHPLLHWIHAEQRIKGCFRGHSLTEFKSCNCSVQTGRRLFGSNRFVIFFFFQNELTKGRKKRICQHRSRNTLKNRDEGRRDTGGERGKHSSERMSKKI